MIGLLDELHGTPGTPVAGDSSTCRCFCVCFYPDHCQEFLGLIISVVNFIEWLMPVWRQVCILFLCGFLFNCQNTDTSWRLACSCMASAGSICVLRLIGLALAGLVGFASWSGCWCTDCLGQHSLAWLLRNSLLHIHEWDFNFHIIWRIHFKIQVLSRAGRRGFVGYRSWQRRLGCLATAAIMSDCFFKDGSKIYIFRGDIGRTLVSPISIRYFPQHGLPRRQILLIFEKLHSMVFPQHKLWRLFSKRHATKLAIEAQICTNNPFPYTSYATLPKIVRHMVIHRDGDGPSDGLYIYIVWVRH